MASTQADSTPGGSTPRRSMDYRKWYGLRLTGDRIGRQLWWFAYVLLFRPSPTLLFGWRRWLLRRFGATMAPSARPYPSAKI